MTEKYLEKLVDKLSSSGAAKLNVNLLNELKSIVREDDSLMRKCYNELMKCFNKSSAKTRLGALHLADYLFNRSSLFRQLLVDDLQIFLQLTVGLNGRHLPPPVEIAQELKQCTMQIVYQWNEKYGKCNKLLSLGYSYLKQNDVEGLLDYAVKTDFLRKTRDEDRENRLEKVRRDRYDEITRIYSSVFANIRLILTEMYEIFEILVPLPANSSKNATHDAAILPYTNQKALELNLDQLHSRPMNVSETAENSILYETLRENFRLCHEKHLETLVRWLDILKHVKLKASSHEKDQRNEILEQTGLIIDEIRTVISMCRDLGIFLNEDEEDMLKVPVDEDDNENINSSPMKPKPKLRLEKSEGVVHSYSGALKDGIFRDDAEKDPLSAQYMCSSNSSFAAVVDKKEDVHLNDDIDENRAELLKIAPFVEFDDDLYFWNKDKIQFNSTGLEFHHRFFGEGVGDNLLSENTVAGLKTRKIYYADVKQQKESQDSFDAETFDTEDGEKEKDDHHSDDIDETAKFELGDNFGKDKEMLKDTVMDRLRKKINDRRSRKRLATEIDRQAQLRLRDKQTFKF